MARSLAQIIANNEQLPDLTRGLVKKYLDTNEYLAWAETVITDRPSIIVPYVADYGSVQRGMDCSTDYETVDISGGNDTFTLVKYGTQYSTCLDAVGLASTFVDQSAEDLKGAVARMANTIAIDAISGTGANGGIVGLQALATNTVAASTVGGAGDVSSLWYLFDAVKAKSGKMALVMNSKTKRAVLSELLETSTVDNTELKGSSFTVPMFNGAAILANDATTDGTIILVNGSPDADGVFPVIGEFPSNKLGLFNFYKVGIHASQDKEVYRLNAHLSHVRKSRSALAAITGWI
jgi:hypothetical protein